MFMILNRKKNIEIELKTFNGNLQSINDNNIDMILFKTLLIEIYNILNEEMRQIANDNFLTLNIEAQMYYD
jgi:hypothetical protein